MNEKVKRTIIKLPVLKSIYRKFSELENSIHDLEYENLIMAQSSIDLRLKAKRMNNEKINVVFVCHRPAVWESLHSVYDALIKDERFNVTIVAIPNKKELPGLWLNHETYESEGAEDFWASYGCINGYDYSRKEWFDLRTLQPDYVFFQTPYNIARPKEYASRVVSRYAKIGYVSYFPSLFADDVYEECTPLDYLRDLSFFFTQHDEDDAFIQERFRKIGKHCCRICNTGYPRYDQIRQDPDRPCRIWKLEGSFRILWTPRWTTNEGNCHFFTYKDSVIKYCMIHEDVELVFRPHPQAFREWNATGEMSTEEQIAFRKYFENSNMHLDESNDYYPLVFSSDCFITDRSTMIVDYLFTGKPIIYCSSNGNHDAILPRIEQGVYKAENWETVVGLLEKIKNGQDPLKEIRDRIRIEYLREGSETAGSRIRDILSEDAGKGYHSRRKTISD